MLQIVEILTYENIVFRGYITWSAILILKIFAMGTLTSFHRFRTKTFSNPEDLNLKKDSVVGFGNVDIERIRRAHRNDLENILPFLTIGLFYILTSPKPLIANNLFRLIGIARILHTLVYAVFVIRQPARAICFLIALLSTVFMAFRVIFYFFYI